MPARTAPESNARHWFERQATRAPKLSAEDELILIRKSQAGDARATDQIIRAHLREVVQQSRQLSGYRIPTDELFSSGSLGLHQALRKFDPERGVRFKTYAAYWVRAYLLKSVVSNWSMVSPGKGGTGSKSFFRLRREGRRLLEEMGDRNAAFRVLADQLKSTPEKVEVLMSRLLVRDLSVDAPVPGAPEQTMLDTLESQSAHQEARLAAEEAQALVRSLFASITETLNEREQLIMEERLLRHRDEQVTLAELGVKLNVTRERVRQIEAELLVKLRRRVQNLCREVWPEFMTDLALLPASTKA